MKLQPQQEIIDIYDTYDNFMKAEKRAKNPFIIEKRKKNLNRFIILLRKSIM